MRQYEKYCLIFFMGDGGFRVLESKIDLVGNLVTHI